MDLRERLGECIGRLRLNVFHESFTSDEQQIDPQLINYLEAARAHLIDEQHGEKSRPYLKIVLEYSWEKLNTGIWQNVNDAYRYCYAYACYMDALADCRMLASDGAKNYRVNVVQDLTLFNGSCHSSRIL